MLEIHVSFSLSEILQHVIAIYCFSLIMLLFYIQTLLFLLGQVQQVCGSLFENNEIILNIENVD